QPSRFAASVVRRGLMGSGPTPDRREFVTFAVEVVAPQGEDDAFGSDAALLLLRTGGRSLAPESPTRGGPHVQHHRPPRRRDRASGGLCRGRRPEPALRRGR